MTTTLVRGGRLVLERGIENGDLLLDGERIVAVGDLAGKRGDVEVDASGCYVLPGLVDFHVHLADRIGRFELADDWASGSRVAAANGITTICSFVTQEPTASLGEGIRRARAKGEGASRVDFLWHLTPTRFEPADWNDFERLAAAGYRTFKLYTTYREAGIYAPPERIGELFRRLGPCGVTFLVHCEDDAKIAAVDPAGLDLSRAATHGRLRPEAAEVEAIEAIVAMARAAGVSLHVVHVSTSAGARLLAPARREGDVTAETGPQYLWLSSDRLEREDGHRWICTPPLRPRREEFRALARDGAFDLFATDHCPFRREDKDDRDPRDVRTVAGGLAGLGALPHLVWKLFEEDPDRAASELALRVSRNPAIRAGVGDRKGALAPGLDADVVVLDPNGPEQPIRSSFAGIHETYPGFTTSLAFRHVLLRGEPLVRGGEPLDSLPPRGRPLQPAP